MDTSSMKKSFVSREPGSISNDEELDPHCTNSLTNRAIDEMNADFVVCDAPAGIGQWGDADLYMSGRWIYGPPSPNNADFAWLQVALRAARPGGTAIVLLPVGTTFRRGSDARTRAKMLSDGAVDCVVMLPPLKRDTSVRLAMWILRRPLHPAEEPRTLLVDATKLGRRNRSGTLLGAE